jgi:putative aldouronate transport system permease protein
VVTRTRGERTFSRINAVALSVVLLVTLYPFVNIVARSLSSESAIRAGRVDLFPRGINFTTYRTVMSDAMFWTNYRNTVVYTVVATAI